MHRLLLGLLPILAFGQFSTLRPPSLSDPYVPLTGQQRLVWFTSATVGPMSLFVAGPWSAGWGTLVSGNPEEYPRNMKGFAQRYGMRLTGVSTGNAMEAGFGAMWGEDPRYFRKGGTEYGSRIKYTVLSTFTARNREGKTMPAYARMIAVPGNNFMSNMWRVESESNVSSALTRTALGFLGRMGANAFAEFWPDIKTVVFKKKP